jgi:hypothetical protein
MYYVRIVTDVLDVPLFYLPLSELVVEFDVFMTVHHCVDLFQLPN